MDVAAPPQTAGGTWLEPATAFERVLHEPVVCSMASLGMIAVSGAEAARFLQGQLTCDVEHQPPQTVVRGGYCTAKGRLLVTFDLWRDGETVFLQVPRELLAPVQKRLSMFVLRAKARLADVSADWRSFAVLGPGAQAVIARWCGEAPAVGATIAHEGALITRAEDGTRLAERFTVRLSIAAAGAWAARLQALPQADEAVWWWSQIDAGVPTVWAATQEKFVPQMINFEVLGGVNFRKGCYPGQEIVARSQYLGKLRRRMALAYSAGPTAAGADIFAAGQPQPVGVVAMVAAAPGGGYDLLFESPVEAQDAGSLYSAAEAPLTLRALPYPLVDVTA